MTRRFTMFGQRIVWGHGALESLAHELSRADITCAAIVCGSSIAEHPDAVDRVVTAAGGRVTTTLPAVRADSPRAAVEELSRLLGEHQVDGVIAVGGGSAIVTARAASILLAEGGRLGDLATTITGDGRITNPKLRAPKLPQIVIPTTPTTAASKAGAAVTHPSTRVRHALFDPHTRAAVIVVDVTLAPAPRSVGTAAATNAYAMVVEGLLAPTASMFTDALLSEALRTPAEQLRRKDDGAVSPTAEERTALAAIMAGEGHQFGPSRPGGGLLPRARDVGRQPERLVRRSGPSVGLAPQSYGVGRTLGDFGPRSGLPPRRRHRHRDATLGRPLLHDLSIAKSDLDDIAAAAMADFAAWQNPLPVSHADALEVLSAAWRCVIDGPGRTAVFRRRRVPSAPSLRSVRPGRPRTSV